MVCSRHTFLPIFGKYTRWLKKIAPYIDDVEYYLEDKEIGLRNYTEYQKVNKDHLTALEDFRKELGIGQSQILAKEASTVASYQIGTTGRSSRNPATRVSGGEDDEADESRDNVHDLSSQFTPATYELFYQFAILYLLPLKPRKKREQMSHLDGHRDVVDSMRVWKVHLP